MWGLRERKKDEERGIDPLGAIFASEIVGTPTRVILIES